MCPCLALLGFGQLLKGEEVTIKVRVILNMRRNVWLGPSVPEVRLSRVASSTIFFFLACVSTLSVAGVFEGVMGHVGDVVQRTDTLRPIWAALECCLSLLIFWGWSESESPVTRTGVNGDGLTAIRVLIGMKAEDNLHLWVWVVFALGVGGVSTFVSHGGSPTCCWEHLVLSVGA